MKSVLKSTNASPRENGSLPETSAPPRSGARLAGVAVGPTVRPQKRRGRSKGDPGLAKRIEDLASRKSEFKGNPRKSAGLLDAFLELVDLMGPEFLSSSPGRQLSASPRRL